MASGAGADSSRGAGENVFQTTDPFHEDEVNHPQERQHESVAESTAPAEQPEDGDGLRLAGVRSMNPFASAEDPSRDNSGAASNSRDLNAARDQESIDRLASANGNELDKVQTGSDWPDLDAISPSEVSPGAGGPLETAGASSTNEAKEDEVPVLRNTDASDYAAMGNVNEAPTQDPSGEPPIEAMDSAERGTDVFAVAEPASPDEEMESPGHSSSDSDSQDKDQKPRVGFADHNEIDKAATHEDSSGDDDVSHGIMEKVTTAVKEKFHVLDWKAKGPLKGMNPTTMKMRVKYGSGDDKDPDNEVGIIWRSRDNRKGRNSVVVPRTSMAYPNMPTKNRPVYSSSFKGVRQNLYRMAFSFPYWDMAFWSGWSYTWGSVLFVIDGVWAWGPVGWDVEWKVEDEYTIGIFFFIGALLYQVGAVMAYLEAVNDGSFQGSAMKRFMEGHEDEKKRMFDESVGTFFKHLNPIHEKHRHHDEEEEDKRMATVDPEAGWKSVHRRARPGSIYPGSQNPAPRRGGIDLGEAEEETHEYLTWRWYPTWHALRYHHIYEIGYIACSIQLFGATLYSWCGLVSVPHLADNWTDADWYGGYWFPEIFGSCCFLSASVMFLLETQEHWWKPQPNVMGWWIGLWAKIGSWGFL